MASSALFNITKVIRDKNHHKSELSLNREGEDARSRAQSISHGSLLRYSIRRFHHISPTLFELICLIVTFFAKQFFTLAPTVMVV